VIHFSEPLGTGLDWAIVDPPGGTLVARPLAIRGGSPGAAEEAAALGLSTGDQGPGSGIAESWLVELRPATTAPVTIRATRTVSLEDGVPIPLAWVEAAESPGGVVVVRGVRGRRPEILNHRLRELPPPLDGEDAALVELSYGPPETLASVDGSPPGDILPPAVAAGARAWAWREVTHVWCHESGELEWKTMIDLENQGRDEITLSVPSALSLDSIEVASVPLAVDPVSRREGASVSIPLPARRGRAMLALAGSARRDATLGWWAIGAMTCGIDVPVLDRDVKLHLPPGLDLAGQPEVGGSTPGWAERLFRGASSAGHMVTPPASGFRAITVTSATRGGIADILVVRRDVVVTLSILAAVGGLIGGYVVAGRSGVAAVACCIVSALAALWLDPPWYAIPRATWWGCLVGAWLAGVARRPKPVLQMSLMVILTVVGVPRVVAQDAVEPGRGDVDAMPLQVFVTPDSAGGTALVPELLFRRLTAASSGLPPVRVMATDTVIEPAGARCTIVVDVDTDRGGSIVLDQRPSGAIWLTDLHEASPGLSVTYAADDTVARLTATVAGRHRVKLLCRPGTARQGSVAVASIDLPAAARGTLQIAGLERPGDVTAGWQCERLTGGVAWVPATRTGPAAFDVAGASRVRVVRPVDSRERLTN
jgi:hypothetical protein